MHAQTKHSGHFLSVAVHHRFGPPLFLLAVLICFFWKVTLTSQFTWLEYPDNANQFMPWQQVQAQAFHEGKLPLWDPYVWGGQSLIGEMVPAVAYPLNWVLYSLPLRDGHIRIGFLHWYRVFLHWLAALFAYWLCRDLGRSQMASILGGLGFTLGGEIGGTMFLQKFNGMIWMPLILLLFLRSIDGKSARLNAALCGFFLGISWLSGHHQVPLYMTLLLGVLWLIAFLRDAELRKERLQNCIVWGLFFLFTGALQLLPSWEYGHQAMRWVGLDGPLEWNEKVPFSIHSQYSLGLYMLFGLIIPTLVKDATAYTGPVLLSLAAIACGAFWRDSRVKLFVGIALAGVLFALGYQNVFYGILYSVIPELNKARSPDLAIVFTTFGAAILASYGFDALRSSLAAEWTQRVSRVTWIGGLVILVIALGFLMTHQLGFNYDDRIIGVAVIALLAAALYTMYAKGQLQFPAMAACCLGLLLIDLGNSTQYYYINERDKGNAVYLRHLSANKDVIEWLRQRPGKFRFGMNSTDVPPSLGDWYGLEAYNGFVASVLAPVVKVGIMGQPARMLYSTRYWISKAPPDANAVEVFTGASGMKVYENAEALPRVRTVHQAQTFASDEQAAGQLFNPSFSARTTVALVGDTATLGQCAGADTATLLKSDFDTVAIDVTMQCQGMLILSDNYDKNWHATMDGKPVPVLRAYTALRAVAVEQGAHRIEMHYRPTMVYAGASMFVLSIFGIAGLIWFEKRGGRA